MGTGDYQDRQFPSEVLLPNSNEMALDVACGSNHTLMLSDTLDVWT